MAKGTEFKFGTYAPPQDSPDRMAENYFRKGARPSSHDPVNCRALSAHSYKMVKATIRTSNCVSSNKARIGN